MKKIVFLTILTGIALFQQGCYRDIVERNTPVNVFDVFWTSMNERYVYFSEKNVDWDSVYQVCRPKITASATESNLTQIFQSILDRLDDGHISIYISSDIHLAASDVNVSRTINWNKIYQHYFSEKSNSNPVFFGQLPNDILYIHITTFMEMPSKDSIMRAIATYSYSNGVIIDVRENAGGYFVNMADMLSLFFEQSTLVGYQKYKTGKGQNDFSDYNKVYIDGCNFVPQSVPKAVLINKDVYSAGNIFAAFMQELSNTSIIGLETLGGGGSPYSMQLPNNWVLSFPRNKFFDLNYRSLESGLPPDINLLDILETNKTISDALDPTLETAISYISAKK
jgi:C-terminal processing protease CtpA/Prc